MLRRRVDAAGGPGLQICHNKKGKDREASEPVLDVDGGGCSGSRCTTIFSLKSWCTPTIPALQEAKVGEPRVRQA